MWFEKVRGGAMHLNHPELVRTLEPFRTYVKHPETTGLSYTETTGGGSPWFSAVEPPGLCVQLPATPCSS